MAESKKRSLQSVALAVDHYMTTGMVWRTVSNMVTPKNKVTNIVEKSAHRIVKTLQVSIHIVEYSLDCRKVSKQKK